MTSMSVMPKSCEYHWKILDSQISSVSVNMETSCAQNPRVAASSAESRFSAE